MEKGVPVFVKIDEYKDILEIMGLIKSKLEQARSVLGKINEIKHQEDNELATWQQDLNEVETKIALIDGTLFEPEGV